MRRVKEGGQVVGGALRCAGQRLQRAVPRHHLGETLRHGTPMHGRIFSGAGGDGVEHRDGIFKLPFQPPAVGRLQIQVAGPGKRVLRWKPGSLQRAGELADEVSQTIAFRVRQPFQTP